MPSTFCLLPKHADDFLEKVRSGAWSADVLSSMTSAERHAAFADVFGDANAQQVNAAFESKLLLRNQQAGIRRWIESTGKIKPDVKRDLLSRVERMDHVLDPAPMTDFLSDLAHQKLGFGVTSEEAGKISELAKNVSDARTANDFDAYMQARRAFREYVGPLQTPPKTTLQGIASFVRAGALSWPTTLVKLSAVAATRTVTTPVTDIAALGIAKVFPGLAEGAPRLGTTSPTIAMRAEGAAQAAAWTDGLIDAGRQLLNKASRLDLMHDDNATAHKWYEYFGSLHGALKEPIKRAEYARSLYRRTADAIARGENTNDLTVKMRLSTESYKDALGAVSMQDNALTSGWNAGLRRLEQADKETGKKSDVGVTVAALLRMDSPVMKAPTNIVAEASQYIGGLLHGGPKLAWEYAHGIENLQPIERDAIIRELSRGAVGAAVMTLYFFKHDLVQFGGFYQPGEKRKQSDVSAGAARAGGLDIPKQLLHNPVFDAAQFAASMARVTESHGKGDHGLGSAVGAATLGILDELPVVSAAKDIAHVVGESGRGEALATKAAGAAIPGVVQWIAKATDLVPKRYPKGLTQHLEANVPGLRQRVPATKRTR